LSYIFTSVFRGKYNQIEKRLKDKFYNAVQDSFKVYIEKYGIYEDIKENVDEDVLEFFKFDDIAGELIGDKS